MRERLAFQRPDLLISRCLREQYNTHRDKEGGRIMAVDKARFKSRVCISQISTSMKRNTVCRDVQFRGGSGGDRRNFRHGSRAVRDPFSA